MYHTMAQNENRREDESALTKKLRDFSERYVKISEEETARTKKLVKDYIEDLIMVHCRENSKLQIIKLEYTGSFYERLKTKYADEVDIMVVLGTPTSKIEVLESEVPGYVRLAERECSVLGKYALPKGYISPDRIRNYWFSLVHRAVIYITLNYNSEFRLVVRNHGPAVQVDFLTEGSAEKLLSVDLVPCFEVDDRYYVPKSLKGKRFSPYRARLWRQSFSLKEKEALGFMDRKDHGCRHEFFRIMKTVVKRPRTSLPLDSYYLKTAFLHYLKNGGLDWVSKDALGKHFFNFLRALQTHMEMRDLPHYWVTGANLLDDFKKGVVEKMANRLRRILESDVRLNEILE